MNVIYIRKTIDTSWGKDTNFAALEKLLGENKMMLTPDKVERMPESYVDDEIHGSIFITYTENGI